MDKAMKAHTTPSPLSPYTTLYPCSSEMSHVSLFFRLQSYGLMLWTLGPQHHLKPVTQLHWVSHKTYNVFPLSDW